MRNSINYPENLPISAAKEQILETIRANQIVIIAGDTGSGKSTQLPKMCLDAGRGKKKLIGCTQPRRLAATSVSARVGEELANLSHLVGYKIRFRDQTGPATRIKFMTDGILLAEAQRDRNLLAYDTIIIDEAHERSLNIDFLLGILKKLVKKRADLKIIITSATIDTEKFSKAFDNAPVIEVGGRTYPVEIRYSDEIQENDEAAGQDLSYVDQAVDTVLDLCRSKAGGDMLVFMPTERDIRETLDNLAKRFRHDGQRLVLKERAPVILPLFGRLSGADQNKIFRKTSARKIVVCTNVAETSVTVPGIRYVVDTGLARISSYNVRAGTTKLPVTAISQASCDQRAGRCGRVGPGICVRLYSEDNYLGRPEFTPPEIVRSNLAEVILRMVALNLGDPKNFPFIDPPLPRAINDGYKLLIELGALTARRKLKARGRFMAALPLDPRISRMILTARDNSCLREVVIIAAALSVQDPRIRPAENAQQADLAHSRFKSTRSDFLSLLILWDSYAELIQAKKGQSALRKFCKKNFLAYQRMREWRDIHEQIWARLATAGSSKKHHHFQKSSCRQKDSEEPEKRYSKGYDAIHQSLLSGNLRNIGLKKEKNMYQGGQGKELMLFPGSGQFNKGGQWIMAAELVETSRLYARTVAGIKQEWIEPLARGLCRYSYSAPHWEKKQGQVVALEKVTLFGLVIEAGRRVSYGRIEPAESRQIFIQSALVEGELGGKLSFLNKNQRLVRNLSDIEERLRRRDILVDDFVLFDFYENRLPKGITDRASLASYIRKNESDEFLLMSEDDILKGLPESDELAEFPQSVHCGELTFPLSYSFQPGKDDDGITVKIPTDLLGHAEAERFEWLVPGLLLEKITLLLKGLPKSIRRQLIPIPRTAESFLEEMTLFEGSLYQQLEDILYRRFRLKVERSAWQRESLPVHLQMRYQLVDGKGKEVAGSRRFTDLAKTPRKESGLTQSASLRKKWEKDFVTGWDFEDLPERIAIKDKKGKLTGFAYPGLVVEGGKVALRLLGSHEERVRKTTEGLRAFYSRHFVKQCKSLRKDIVFPRAYWALYEGVSSHEELNEDIFSFILMEIFDCWKGLIPDRKEYEHVIAAVKQQGLHVPGKKIMDEVIELLRARRAVLDYIGEVEGDCRAKSKMGISLQDCTDFRNQVGELLPPRFLRELSRAELVRTPVYLKAICVRMERKILNPAKDASRAEQLAVHQQRLISFQNMDYLTSEQRQIGKEFHSMIEEFKISLFAQELKTVFPISAKRLEKKWREMKEVIDG